MEFLLELLKILLPSLVVFLTAWIMLKSMLENDNRKKLLELKMSGQQLMTPVRLQAYERVILFLERISPHSLVMRHHLPGITSIELQQRLIAGIREEYEHNLSQQIYISAPAWELIRNAKEEMIRLINTAAAKLPAEADSTALSSTIFELSAESGKLPVQSAIDYIKKEFRQVF